MSADIDRAMRQRLLAAYETILLFETDRDAAAEAMRRYIDLSADEIDTRAKTSRHVGDMSGAAA